LLSDENRALLRLIHERQPRTVRPEALATEFLIVLD
jgi:predicted transcriptional regulator